MMMMMMTELTAKSVVCVIIFTASAFCNGLAGTECPESKKLYPGDCRLFYKCVQLPSPAHAYVWVPTRCSAGLVYQPMLKTCVLPGNAWDCQRGDGSTLSNDIQSDDVFGSAKITASAFTTPNLTTTVLPVAATESTTVKPKQNVIRPENVTQRPLVEELFLANLRKKIAIQNAIATNQLAIHNAVVGNQKALVASQSLPFTNINSPNIDRIGQQLHGLVPLVSRLKAIPKRPAATYRNPYPVKSPAQLPQFLAYPKVELNLLPEQLKKITEQLVMQTATPPLFSAQKTNLNFLAPEPLRYTKHNITKVDSLPQNQNPHGLLLLSYLSQQGFKLHEDGHNLINVTFTQLLQKEPAEEPQPTPNNTSSPVAKTEQPPNAVIKPQTLRKKPAAPGSIRRGPTKRPTASTTTTTERAPPTKKISKRRKIKPKPSRRRLTTTTTQAPVKKVHKHRRTRPHKKRIASTTPAVIVLKSPQQITTSLTTARTTTPTTTTTTPATTTTRATTPTTTTTTTTIPPPPPPPPPTTTTTVPTPPPPPPPSSTPAISVESAFLQQIAESNEAALHFISIPSCRDGERFANPSDCTRYYICSDLSPRKYVCPPYTAFNKGRRMCDANEYRRCVNHETVESVTRSYTKIQTVFTCQASGKFRDPTSPSHYYFCLQNTTSPGWKQRRYQCPDAYTFCDSLHMCTLSNQCS